MKKIPLLMLLASLFALAGCDSVSRYYPSHGGNYVKPPEEEEHHEEEEEDDELLCTYSIYFSYNSTTKYNPVTNKDEDSPILSFTAPMLKALGQVPSEVATDGKVDETKVLALGAAKGFSVDPTFPKFLGFSFNGACLDESGLWDFTKDYKQLAVVTLYGVWVSNE